VLVLSHPKAKPEKCEHHHTVKEEKYIQREMYQQHWQKIAIMLGKKEYPIRAW
jgi:hypothetical protein